MFGQTQLTPMFQMCKLETVYEAVAKPAEFAEYPKAPAEPGQLKECHVRAYTPPSARCLAA
jgi:hypothetical protein